MAILTYVTFICHDIDRLAEFYGPLLELEEIAASRSEFYREFLTGGSKLGFACNAAYTALSLPERPQEAPVNAVLSFDVGATDRVDALTAAAVEAGARLTKPAGPTTFGQYQSALADPEGNIFRISAAVSEQETAL